MVITDRAFPGVALWKAYTQAGAHLLIRARTFVAVKPMEVLSDGTYPTRMNLAGQRRSHPGWVTVRGIDYQVDGGETIRLLTDLLDPEARPAEELAALYHERWEVESAYRQLKTCQRGKGRGVAVGVAGTGAAGDLGPPDPPSLSEPNHHHAAGRRRGSGPRPELVRQGPQAHTTQRRPPGRPVDPPSAAVHEADGHESRAQVRQRSSATARGGPLHRHPVSQFIVRKKDQVRRGTRRVPDKVITHTPAILQSSSNGIATTASRGGPCPRTFPPGPGPFEARGLVLLAMGYHSQRWGS
ncbi:transposase [Streptomyces sp. NPDC006971]|uniref:transposase n=1 Tax=Streptomyces sp. NPDC006971 TaxID=3154784 RepID=UPI0034042556